MQENRRFKTFLEFYPYYLTEHANPTCRTLHFIGTTLVFVLLLIGLVTLDWYYFTLIPVAGYGFAWTGHAFFEQNKPATFSYPLYSLGSDFVMYWHILTGQIQYKLKEAEKLFPAKQHAPE